MTLVYEWDIRFHLLTAPLRRELPPTGASGTALNWHTYRMPYHTASRVYLPGSDA